MVNYNINKAMVISAIGVVAGLIDNILGVSTPKKETKSNLTYAEKNPLIGRRMIVQDNSWCIDKESGCRCGLMGKEVVIVSSPYKVDVKESWEKEPCYHIFVDVASLDSGRRYRVLFNEGWLIDEKTAPKVKVNVETNENNVSPKPRNYWTPERVEEESKKYSSRIAFKKGSRGAYDAALNYRMMDSLFA